MTVMSLIMGLADQGIFPYVNGKKLVLTPAAKLTDELRLQVRNNKPALMANLIELQRFPEWNWSAFEANPGRFRAFAELVMISEMRAAGQVPDHYTEIVHCESCNQDVPHFPVNADSVLACVWCLNGQTQLSMRGANSNLAKRA